MVPLVVSQVKIEKHYVDIGTAEYQETLGCGTALGDHLEIGLRCEQAGQAFPE